MALIKCPECGKEISDASAACIHCGYPLNKNSGIQETEAPNVESKEKEIPKIIGEEKENIKRLKELYDIYLEFKKFENLVGWDRFITKFKMKHNKCDISIRILEKYEDKYKDGK